MKIGITYTGDIAKHNNYKHWIEQDDAIETVLLKPGISLEELDGLVLSGGIDIDPSFYGGSAHYPDEPSKGWQKERDEYELEALRYAIDRKIPVLGVCRGLQLINVFCKGALTQDLGLSLNDLHRAAPEDKQHTVAIEQDSFLYDLVQQPTGKVNSAHHQSIDRLGEGLLVNARSAEGIIEGIEWKDKANKPFMLAVQWHPERMYINKFKDAPLYNAIRNRFIEEARNSNQKTT